MAQGTGTFPRCFCKLHSGKILADGTREGYSGSPTAPSSETPFHLQKFLAVHVDGEDAD